MNLKQEINRTETEKNKTKKVATNIDNKLVELGGEQAIDLSDVPNKIEKTLNNNLIKTATINIEGDKTEGFFEYNRDFSNFIDFIPKKAILEGVFYCIDATTNSQKEFYDKFAIEMVADEPTRLALQVCKARWNTQITFERISFYLLNKRIEIRRDDSHTTLFYEMYFKNITFIG